MAHDWVEMDGQVLIAARKEKGLSREALGAIVGVVAKTVERYENQGRVPRSLLPRFAQALDLDVQETPRRVVTVTAADVPADELAALREELAEVLRLVRQVLALLEKQVGRPSARAGRAAKQRPA